MASHCLRCPLISFQCPKHGFLQRQIPSCLFTPYTSLGADAVMCFRRPGMRLQCPLPSTGLTQILSYLFTPYTPFCPPSICFSNPSTWIHPPLHGFLHLNIWWCLLTPQTQPLPEAETWISFPGIWLHFPPPLTERQKMSSLELTPHTWWSSTSTCDRAPGICTQL